MNLKELNEHAEGKILSGVEDQVGYLVINNPERHNAMSLEMWEAAAEAIDSMADDPDVRVLVVTGTGGKAFVSGADVSKFGEERNSKEAVEKYAKISGGCYDALEVFPKPTIAAIKGFCIGGGLNLAVCCDLRIAEERSRFGIPAAKLGLGYGFAGIRRLSKIVSSSSIQEIFYTARQFSAQEAYDMGLVNRVLSPAMFDAFLNDYTSSIKSNAPLTLAAVKASTLAVNQDADDRDMAKIESMVQACFDSADYAEGQRAFMAKEKPKFTGK